MKHLKQGRRLSRSVSHRKALLAALSTALIKHKRIRTTAAKAKETRRIIEPIITRARDAYLREQSGDSLDIHARREIAKFIRDKDAVKILFSDIAEKVGKRPGGYTRVLKLGHRLGDGAEMAVIELVDYNDAQDDKKRQNRAARSKEAAARRKAAAERKAQETETENEAVETEEAEAAATDEAPTSEAAVDNTVDAAADETSTNADSGDAADEADGEAAEEKK